MLVVEVEDATEEEVEDSTTGVFWYTLMLLKAQ